jgi:hypothetical protein
MAKLGIERRVQYGAEKMLDVSRILAIYESCKLTWLQVIEQQSGLETGGMKDKITAQLESAANKIRELEEKLERLRGGGYLLCDNCGLWAWLRLMFSYPTEISNETTSPTSRL